MSSLERHSPRVAARVNHREEMQIGRARWMDRATAVKRDGEAEHLALARLSRGVGHHLAGDEIGGAKLVILAPAAPVGQLPDAPGFRISHDSPFPVRCASMRHIGLAGKQKPNR
jgi:hypothetical protein